MAEVTRCPECGFCLQRNGRMEEPKMLPCRHVHCLRCLTSSFDMNRVIVCPIARCGEVFDSPVTSLPSYNCKEDSSSNCDVCTNKLMQSQPAAVYCLDCSRKFCVEHQESHDDVLGDHTKISICEYQMEAAKLEVRVCSEHKTRPFSIGCKLCLSVFCVDCTSASHACNRSECHELVPLTELVQTLNKGDIQAQVLANEDVLEMLYKQSSQACSEYDTKTTKLIEQLHQTRDEQLRALKERYDLLEDSLLKERQQQRVRLEEFMQMAVLTKWTQARNWRLKIRSTIQRSHQVDIVTAYREVRCEMQKLVAAGLPKLEIRSLIELKHTGQRRDVEMELVTTAGLLIDADRGMTVQPIPAIYNPLSLCMRTLDVDFPTCISPDRGSVFVGTKCGTVRKIDEHFQLSEDLFTCSGTIHSITVYKDSIYTLSAGSVVGVYDMSGNRVQSWKHSCFDRLCNVLAIVSGQMVLPDQRIKDFVIYSLDGHVIRRVACSRLAYDTIAMCAADDDSVVVSHDNLSQVFRVNIKSGEVMWSCSNVQCPQGLSCYQGRYVFVATYNNNSIRILDLRTGNTVSEVRDGVLAGLYVFDVEVYSNTLAVANYSNNRIVFYRITGM